MSITLTGHMVIFAYAIAVLMIILFVGVLSIATLHVYSRAWDMLARNTRFHRELVDFVRHKYAEKRKRMT